MAETFGQVFDLDHRVGHRRVFIFLRPSETERLDKREPDSIAEVQLAKFAWPERADRGRDLAQVLLNSWPTGRRKDKDGEFPSAQVLLLLQVLVSRDHGVEVIGILGRMFLRCANLRIDGLTARIELRIDGK